MKCMNGNIGLVVKTVWDGAACSELVRAGHAAWCSLVRAAAAWCTLERNSID